MATHTPTIGLKKPEGSDPFLTSDFAENYDRIDQAFAVRPVGGGTTATHDHPEYLTQAEGDTLYVKVAHLDGHATGTGTTGGITKEEADLRYAFKDHGTHGGTTTEDASIVKSPGRTNPRTIFSVTGFALNNQNGVVVTFGYSAAAFASPPTVLATVQVGSNYDLLPNVQGRTAVDASVRCAQIKGVQITTTGQLQWMAIGV